MSIGQNLRYYRKEMGLTQEELAEGICHTTYISKIENGNIDPPKETLNDLCYKLGITVEQVTQNIDEEKWLLLDKCLQQIKDKKNGNNHFTELITVFHDIVDPFLLSRYYTIMLRYFIFIKDKQKAEVTSHKVKNYKNYLTPESEYDYYFSLGLFEYHFGRLHTSHTYYSQAERIIKDKGIIEPELLYYMALTLSRINKISLSTTYAYSALELYNREMNYGRSTDCNLILGINYNLMEEYDSSEKFFLKVINAAKYHDMSDLIKAKAYHNLGNIYSKQGKSEKAIDVLCKSLQFKKQINKKSNTIYLLAKSYFAIGEIDKGKEWLFEGMNLVEKTDDIDYNLKMEILYFQSVNQVNSSEYQTLLKKSISYFTDTDPSFSCECAELLAELHAKEFRYKEAYEHLQLANKLMKKK